MQVKCPKRLNTKGNYEADLMYGIMATAVDLRQLKLIEGNIFCI